MTTKSERNLSFDEILSKREAEFERDYGFTGKASAEYVPMTPDEEFNTTTFGPLKHAPWDNIDPDPVWHKPDALYDMAVGDVNSNAKGSGARANGDKVPLDLIPVSVWRNKWRTAMSQHVEGEILMDIMYALQRWQEGEDEPLSVVLAYHDLDGACRVLEYGADKYAVNNWMKGMAWSVPLGCALRHLQAVIKGEHLDNESGLPHIDHALCNIIMLDYFETIYPEGDDRPLFEEYNK